MDGGEPKVVKEAPGGAGEVVVRPRSSHRKQRSPSTPREQRAPAQDRSRRRHEAILAATETLLQTANIEDISLSDIGEKAGISKASVHYHFPTVAAVQLELGRRYDVDVQDLLSNYNAKLAAMRVPTWQEWMRLDAVVARDFLNSHRPACETLLGPLLNRQNRLATFKENSQLGLLKLENLCKVFDVPNRQLLERVFVYYGEILDVFWSGSYLKHGHIDDWSFDESLRAGIGYLRNFLPEVLPMKEGFDSPTQSAGPA